MLTIFTTTKTFDGHARIIQTNALESWARVSPESKVFIFGDEPGTAEATQTLDFIHIPCVETTESGLPLISDMFRQAQDIADTPLLCFLNSDIILTSRFQKAISALDNFSGNFLLLSQRIDVDVKKQLDFSNPKWEQNIFQTAEKSGHYGGPTCNDCFLFPKGMYQDIPPFAVGRIGWDNWMVFHTLSRGIPIIDATKAVTLIHQNHDYPIEAIRVVDAQIRKIPVGEDTRKNLDLAGKGGEGFHGIWDANLLLTDDGIKFRQKNFDYFLQHVIKFSIRRLNLRRLFRILLKFRPVSRFWISMRGR